MSKVSFLLSLGLKRLLFEWRLAGHLYQSIEVIRMIV